MIVKEPVSNALIDQIGPGIVREHFGITPQVLSNWRVRGVPVRKRIAFNNLALTRGVATPPEFLAPLGIAA